MWCRAALSLFFYLECLPRLRYAQSQAATRRTGELGRGRRDGRRAGQRQAGRLDHHRHRGERRARAATASRRSKLEPGKYALQHPRGRLRARRPAASRLRRRKATTADLKLRRTEDLAGAALERGMDGEHARQRPAEGPCCSTASAATRSSASCARATTPMTFIEGMLPRMQGYVNQSIPQHPQLRKAERLMEERGDQRVQVYRAHGRVSGHDQSQPGAASGATS